MKDLLQNIDWWSIIVGAVIGAIIPWLSRSLFRLFKPERQKFHISLYKKGEELTFSSAVKDLVEVDVKYKGERYDGVISILNIELKNDGQNAISFVNHFNRPILLKSSKFRIIGAISDDGTAVNTKIEMNEDHTVSISWDLLKQKESIKIQLIGQLIDTDSRYQRKTPTLYPSFFESLQFNVRSDCVDYIKPERIPYTRMAAYFTLVFILMALFQIAASLREEKTAIKEYTFVVEDTEVVGALSYDEDRNCVRICPLDSIEPTSIFDINKHPKVSISVSNVRGMVVSIVFGYMCMIAFIWLLLITLHFFVKSEDKKKVFEA